MGLLFPHPSGRVFPPPGKQFKFFRTDITAFGRFFHQHSVFAKGGQFYSGALEILTRYVESVPL